MIVGINRGRLLKRGMIADFNDPILKQIMPVSKLSIVKIFLPFMFCLLAMTPARKIIEER